MQTYTEADLEAILRSGRKAAPKEGVDPDSFQRVYEAAIAQVQEVKSRSVKTLYESLQPDAWFVDSMQMAHSQRGDISGLPISIKYGGITEFDLVRQQLNKVFGTQLSGSKRGENQVYVWLEPTSTRKGTLHSYGDAHADAAGRTNMHYFAVLGDADKLTQVIDSFSQNPANLSSFVSVVFDWKNETRRGHSFSSDPPQPDLFTRMKELYLNVPGKPIHKITLS